MAARSPRSRSRTMSRTTWPATRCPATSILSPRCRAMPLARCSSASWPAGDPPTAPIEVVHPEPVVAEGVIAGLAQAVAPVDLLDDHRQAEQSEHLIEGEVAGRVAAPL